MGSRGPTNSQGATYVELSSENPFASDSRARSHGGNQSTNRRAAGKRAQTNEDPEYSADEQGQVIVLPTENPFASGTDRGPRRRNGPPFRPPASRRPAPPAASDDGPEDEEFHPPPEPARARSSTRFMTRPASPPPAQQYSADEQDNVTVLPTENPFASGAPRRRNGPPFRPPASRRSAPPAASDDGSEDEEFHPRSEPARAGSSTRFMARPASPPPVQPRRSGTVPGKRSSGEPAPRTRLVAPPISYSEDEETVNELVHQRMGNPKHQLKPVGNRVGSPEEDNRLIIQWVDNVPTARPMPPKPRPEEVQPQRPPSPGSGAESEPPRSRSPVSSVGEGGMPEGSAAGPNHRGRRGSHGAWPGPRIPDAHRHPHYHPHHHHHCPRGEYLPPYCHPPFPTPPPEWPGYNLPRQPYGPYNLYQYPYSHPLFANIAPLPSLLEQCRVPYPELPVPPVPFLRELQRENESSPPVGIPPLPSVPNPNELDYVLGVMQTGVSATFLTLLSVKELDSSYVDQVFRKLTNVVQVRFGERQGDTVVNRVHVVPRGRLALQTVMSAHPKLDIDLVIPSDYILRRWNTSASDESNGMVPTTIADALHLHPTSIARGEVEATKLRWVFQAVWEQLNGSADRFIFPGGSDEASRYLPANWCGLYKDNVTDSNRLRLVTRGVFPIYINVFVKVALTLYGQEMIVGVDQSSAKSGGSYQLIKVLRAPGVSLSEAPLCPVYRTAILTLNWWQSTLKISVPVPGGSVSPPLPKIRTSHFILALAALQRLDPKEEPDLYLSPVASVAQPFSLLQVLQAMLKVLQYLARAYRLPMPSAPSLPEPPMLNYPFPLSSCATTDALYSQLISKPIEMATLIASLIIPQMISKIQAAIKVLDPTGAVGGLVSQLPSPPSGMSPPLQPWPSKSASGPSPKDADPPKQLAQLSQSAAGPMGQTTKSSLKDANPMKKVPQLSQQDSQSPQDTDSSKQVTQSAQPGSQSSKQEADPTKQALPPSETSLAEADE